MITALEMGAGILLTAMLLTAAIMLSAFQLGRLVTRDDEQRQVEAADALRVARSPRGRAVHAHGLRRERRHPGAIAHGAIPRIRA